MRLWKWCLAALFVAASASAAGAQWAPMVTDTEANRTGWWREARFGLFLHWGLYSIPGRGEWVQWSEQIPVSEYAKLAGSFSAEHFDPETWASAAKDAGMRYVVLTSRHHDGFALFDDPGSDFTAMHAAAHRDLVREYVDAMRSAGLKVGLYYSPLDWRYPGFFFPDLYRTNAEALRTQYHLQLHELAANYGKLDVLWFDGGGANWLGFGGVQFTDGWHARPSKEEYHGGFDWEDREAVSDLRKLQPGAIVNDRTDAPADFRSREGDNAMGEFDNKTPWELCTTITDGAWGYQPDAPVKPLNRLIGLLVGAAGRDGNLLLNVGPRPDGTLVPEQVQRLKQMGEWLKQYGVSIYGTRGGPFLPGSYGVSTRKGTTVYVHLTADPGSRLRLPPLAATMKACEMLTGGKAACTQTVAGIDVLLDVPARGVTPDRILAITLDRPAGDVALVRTDGGTPALAPIAQDVLK